MKKVTIIVPVYNMQKYIEECLDSCVNQSYENLEIIVIDDGSTDESLETITKYKSEKQDERIDIISMSNKGLSVARNEGLKRASGEYKKLAEISGYRLVVTDMLHCMIFCALTGTPCIAVDNLTGKVSGVYNWISELQYIRCVEYVKELLLDIDADIMLEPAEYTFDYMSYGMRLKELLYS